jgi:hypothetical protein
MLAILLFTPDSFQIRVRNILLATLFRDALCSPLICIPLLQSPHVLIQLRVGGLIEWHTTSSALKSKMQHDVRSREFISTEELASGFGEVIFKEIAVFLELRIDERSIHLASDASGDWLEEERNRCVLDVCDFDR